MMASELNVETTSQRAATVLTVTGEIDLATAPDLGQRLAKVTGSGDIVADLTGVTFIDSTGLWVLISAHEAATEAGGRLCVVVTDGVVTKLLRITGVDRELHVFASLSEALDAGDG
jgi:anti-anti-sigma factor